MTVSSDGLRVPANAVGSFSVNKDGGVHTKISLRASRLATSPACIAGVRVSRPNFRAPCGRTKL